MAGTTEGRTPTGTPVDGVWVVGALSPSRAADFKTCALRYRLRTVDRLEEPPSPGAARGTVVHKVLEDLFSLPAPERTPARAEAMVDEAWQSVRELEPALAVPTDVERLDDWLDSCRGLLRAYFELEDPGRLEPAGREEYVETVLDGGVLLRGVIDRLDVARDGSLRVVDYKTSRAVAPGLEARALFQLRCYALALWRTRGVVPAVLRLIYLGDATTVSYRPDEHDLRATERQLQALWEAIARAHESGEWLPRRGRHCTWCSFRALCPEFGGTPPPLPGAAPGSDQRVTTPRQV